MKGEAFRLLITNSSAKSVYENIYNFKKRLRAGGYPHNLIEKITSEVKNQMEVSFTKEKWSAKENSPFRYYVPACFAEL